MQVTGIKDAVEQIKLAIATENDGDTKMMTRDIRKQFAELDG